MPPGGRWLLGLADPGWHPIQVHFEEWRLHFLILEDMVTLHEMAETDLLDYKRGSPHPLTTLTTPQAYLPLSLLPLVTLG